MKTTDRKAALAAYRERKVECGIYALRCLATGEVWAGSAPDLATIRNRHWFTLRMGSHTVHSLQSAWQAHGEQAMAFEVVERLAGDVAAMSRDRMLKERLAHWLGALGAQRI